MNENKTTSSASEPTVVAPPSLTEAATESSKPLQSNIAASRAQGTGGAISWKYKLIAIAYILIESTALFSSVYFVRTDFKLATSSLILAIVLSQVVIDNVEFSSPKAKGLFSAVFRILAGAFAIALIYSA